MLELQDGSTSNEIGSYGSKESKKDVKSYQTRFLLLYVFVVFTNDNGMHVIAASFFSRLQHKIKYNTHKMIRTIPTTPTTVEP